MTSCLSSLFLGRCVQAHILYIDQTNCRGIVSSHLMIFQENKESFETSYPYSYRPLYMKKQSICGEYNGCKWARTITLVGTVSLLLDWNADSQAGTNAQFIVVYGELGCYKDSTIGCFHSAWDFRQTLQWEHDAVHGGGSNRWVDEMLSSSIPFSHRGGSWGE